MIFSHGGVTDVRLLGRRLGQSSDSIRGGTVSAGLVCLEWCRLPLEASPDPLGLPQVSQGCSVWSTSNTVPDVDTVQCLSLYQIAAPQRQNLLLSRPIYASPKKHTTSKQLHSSGEE